MKSLTRIGAVAAAAGAGVVVPLIGLGAPVGAAGVAASGPTAGLAASPAATALPNSTIKGTTATWIPKALTATGKWNGTETCTASVASFTMTNKETVTEDITVTGTDKLGKLTGSIAADSKVDLCVTSGYAGTVHVALTDKHRLTVTF